MAYQNLLQSNIELFAQRAREKGWTKEEVLSVITAVQEEVNDCLCKGHACYVKDLIKKHVAPIIEARNKQKGSTS